MEWLTQTKRNDVVDSSFSSMRGCGSHNEKNKALGPGRRHGCGRGSRGGCDDSSQTHDNSNREKDNSMIKCYSHGKYGHYAVECRKKKRDVEGNLTLTRIKSLH